MRFKTIITIGLALGVITIVFFIAGRYKAKPSQDYTSELKADGEQMVHTTYNKEGQKAMELRCSELKRVTNDKLALKKIDALIFKKGQMNKDVHVAGEKGEIFNNNLNFIVENNAQLIADQFTMTSRRFFLKDQAVMNTTQRVVYKTDQVNGVARDGMELFLNLNVLKFFTTRGHYKRDNQDFEFRTDTLWIIDKDKIMVMEGNTIIRDPHTLLKSPWISASFSGKFELIKQAIAQKGSYFFYEDPEKQESKEVKSSNITCDYNEAGQLSKLTVMQGGEIYLKDPDKETDVFSDFIEMNLEPVSGRVQSIDVTMPGRIENRGKSNFKIAADKMHADYNEKGEPVYLQGNANSSFTINDYRGTSDQFMYFVDKNSLIVEGPASKIESGSNTFNSAKFKVDTLNKVLSTDSNVKSVIQPKKKNVLFSQNPILINSAQFTIYEKENRLLYRNQVSLTQDDISLTALNLEITDGNKIAASGKVSLTFNSLDRQITIKGEQLIFNASRKQVEIDTGVTIKMGETILMADRVQLGFDDSNEIETLNGSGDVSFQKDVLTGTAGKAQWFFKKDLMVLRQLPQITRKNSGTTSGEELQINLKNNMITILSGAAERTETIIH